ncbi:MAG: ABC transporter substrate-binding protein [Pseudomonadota bacterium]
MPARLIIAAFASLGLITTASAQERIVSVGGDVTEILYELGRWDDIVANDSTSMYPADAETKPKVGYLRNLSAEGVLSAEPSLILISGAAGPAPAVEQLRASGVTMIEMEPDYTVDGIIEKVTTVASAVGEEEAGEVLSARIAGEWAEAQDAITALGISPKVLFFAALRDGAPRAAGTYTAADGVIRMLGGVNVFSDFSGFKPLSLEAAVAADPDIILIMDHHAERVGGIDSVDDHPALRLTTAAKEGRIVMVDQVTVMQFGPRMPNAVREVAERIAAGDTIE